jgi:import inner membrane translocase subunit TIM22
MKGDFGSESKDQDRTDTESQPTKSNNPYQNPYGTTGPAHDYFMLPFFKQVKMAPAADEIPYIASLIPEACGTKIVTGGVMGAVIGIGLGAFMGAMGDQSPIQIINGKEVPTAPLREQMRGAFKSTAAKTGGWAKSFGILTALFGGVECLVEKYRAKHDVWNPVISGCVVGATLSAKGGPTVSITMSVNIFTSISFFAMTLSR